MIEKDPDVVVEWVSWEGRPPGQDFAGYTPEQKKENYEAHHRPLAEKYGVPLRPAGADYRTTNLHMATYYARDKGKFREFRDRCYKARWVDDLDLENAETIAGLGEEVGLDGGEIKAVIAEGRYVGALRSQRAQGKGLGIFGIPTFVVEGRLFWGKDVIDDVRAEVARVREARLEKEKEEG